MRVSRPSMRLVCLLILFAEVGVAAAAHTRDIAEFGVAEATPIEFNNAAAAHTRALVSVHASRSGGFFEGRQWPVPLQAGVRISAGQGHPFNWLLPPIEEEGEEAAGPVRLMYGPRCQVCGGPLP